MQPPGSGFWNVPGNLATLFLPTALLVPSRRGPSGDPAPSSALPAEPQTLINLQLTGWWLLHVPPGVVPHPPVPPRMAACLVAPFAQRGSLPQGLRESKWLRLMSLPPPPQKPPRTLFLKQCPSLCLPPSITRERQDSSLLGPPLCGPLPPSKLRGLLRLTAGAH